jgi:hypothetical protein
MGTFGRFLFLFAPGLIASAVFAGFSLTHGRAPGNLGELMRWLHRILL